MKKCFYISCSDAGSSNLIYYWYLNNKKKFNFFFNLSGPAKKIFNKKNTKINKKIDFIVTGTGKNNKKYIKEILFGKKNNIKTISFVDHYTNYYARFFYLKSLILPDEIWTFDKASLALAKKFYIKTKVLRKKNYYLEFIKKNYLKINKGKKLKKNDSLKILFLLEPLKISYKMQNIICLKIVNFLKKYKKKIKLTFRLHPSENNNLIMNNISQKLVNNKNISILKNKDNDIIKSLYSADIIIGGQTYALVLSLKLKKKIYTFLPFKNYPFNLPFKGINKI
tara:strand:+ start:1870 stop:2712 length:843 start_codon:yes stop_codon:yes gene_type:complete